MTTREGNNRNSSQTAGKRPNTKSPRPTVASPLERLKGGWSSIRYKIVLPYFLLTLIVASLGIFTVTRLIATGFEERFTNQLLEAGRVANDGIVRQEADQIETLRPMVQTTGVQEAILNHDTETLIELLEVHAYNANIDSVLIMDGAGNLIIEMTAERTRGIDIIDQYAYSTGGNFAHLPIVSRVLGGFRDQRGDKFAGLVDTPSGTVLYTSAPVYSPVPATTGPPEIVGVIMVGTRLDRILFQLKSESLADIAIYVDGDTILESTLPDWEAQNQYSQLVVDEQFYEDVLHRTDETQLRELRSIELFERTYRVAYSPMVVRNQVFGVIGVMLPSNFIVTQIGTSRNAFILLFSLATALVIVVGLVISQTIVKPITELVSTSRAIYRGELESRANVETKDEIGLLATSFNEMTARLQLSSLILEEENARTNAIVDSAVDGVVVRDPTGYVIMINPAAREMLRGDSGEPNTEVLKDYQTEDGAVGLARRLEHRGRIYSITVAPVLTPDLDPDADDHLIGDVLVLRDITDEALAERTKDNFLNQIGHELRTPLTSLQLFAEALYKGHSSMSDDSRSLAARTVFEQSRVLSNMINQIIELTAIQSGSLQLNLKQFDLYLLLQDSIRFWKPDMDKSGISITSEHIHPETYITGDPKRLRSVFDAVLQNAVQYSPAGGNIHLTLSYIDDYICINIKDSGVGISDDDLPHVFDRFYRGAPEDDRGNPVDVRGMGQGLYAVKSIMDAHQGSVEVQSTLGKGTIVTLYLPQN